MKNYDIALFIENKSINKNGIFLLDYNNMKVLIAMCEKNKTKVLGIDAFSLQENRIQPQLNRSIDFSSEFSGAITPTEYIKQLDESCKHLLFEVVIE